MKCFTQSEASQHISAIQNAFKNNFKTICNALMPDMNTSHTFTMPEAYKYKQYINGLRVNEYLTSDPT